MKLVTIKETITYQIEVRKDNFSIDNDVWTIADDLNAIDDMPTPFGDGYPDKFVTDKKIEIIDEKEF